RERVEEALHERLGRSRLLLDRHDRPVTLVVHRSSSSRVDLLGPRRRPGTARTRAGASAPPSPARARRPLGSRTPGIRRAARRRGAPALTGAGAFAAVPLPRLLYRQRLHPGADPRLTAAEATKQPAAGLREHP